MTTKMQDLRLPAADSALHADAKELRRTLSDLIRVVQFRDRDRICCHDVTVSQCHALEAIARSGPLRLNDLAAHLYLDKSTTSRVVDALVSKDYVERTPDPSDGRAVQLAATDSGRRLVGRVESELHAESAAALLGLDADTRRGVLRVLDLLVRRQQQRVEVEAGCCRWRPVTEDGELSGASCC